jgi:carboxymethylenebutenolidase
VSGSGLGVTGFCAGGGLALWLATLRPDAVKAVVPYYGLIPWPDAQPDYSKLQAAVQGHYAANDDFADPETVRQLEEELKGRGNDVEFFTYPDTDHAFTNHHRPDVFHAEHSETAWRRTIAFFRQHLT